MNLIIQQKLKTIKAVCEKRSVDKLFLFGSAANGNFGDLSDLDFAVTFNQNLSPLEFGDAFLELKQDLENIFQREIDLISYRVIKNQVFKEELDRTKVALYAA